MPNTKGHYEIGKVYKRGDDLIYITSGKYMGHLGVSNHWNWRIVKSNGTLGEEGYGYGDFPVTPVDCEITVKIKLKELSKTGVNYA